MKYRKFRFIYRHRIWDDLIISVVVGYESKERIDGYMADLIAAVKLNSVVIEPNNWELIIISYSV